MNGYSHEYFHNYDLFLPFSSWDGPKIKTQEMTLDPSLGWGWGAAPEQLPQKVRFE